MRSKSPLPAGLKGTYRLGLSLLLSLLTTPVTGQQGLWESLIDQGNRALAAGDAAEARKHFDRAWEVAGDYPAHDLRRATTQRNLAQARMLLGDLEVADSLYTRAIACADRTLEPQHQYTTSLRREQALLREAIAASQIYNEEQPAPLTIWEALAQGIRWTANHTTGGLAMSQPLGEPLATSHDRGLGLDLSLDYTFRELGSLPLIAGLDYFRTERPN
ncbi:MAG: tetratricopeptide repeat protein, partial [Candidatus Neomarinimicrobiota bacterium]